MDVQQLFPETKEGDYGYLEDYPSYDEMVRALGDIVVQVDDDDYQGDSRYLIRSGERFGYVNIGWGSCSGCDALQACTTVKDVQDLFDDIEGSIKWFDSLDEAREWLSLIHISEPTRPCH
jgi:hypothetical protein